MKEQILLPPDSAPRRRFWKPWKWIGLIVYAAALLFDRYLPGLFIVAAYFYGIIVIANLVFAGFRYLKNKLFWRVRNRLIGSFVFVGVIPLLAFMAIVILSSYVISGQMAGQYLRNALQENNHLISEINAEMAGQVTSSDPATAFPSKAASVCSRYFARFPRLASRLLLRNASGNLVAKAKYDPQIIFPELSPHPGDKWLNGSPSFEGTLMYQGRIFLTSLRQVPGSQALYVETLAPLDASVEAWMRRDKSLYVTFFVQSADIDIRITQKGANVVINKTKDTLPERKDGVRSIKQKTADLNSYRRADSRRMISWFLPLNGKVYESGKDDLNGAAIFYMPWRNLASTYLSMGLEEQRGPAFLIVLCVLAGVFGFTELVSLVIGFTISRRVTRSVHDMYQGILALQKGDLGHRIPVRKSDQLGLLAHSFNQMSGSISRLLEEVVEKKRLEQELEIAREVQATLFPKQLPHPPGMAVFGGCKPAQVVSGDYYDFVLEDETHLDIIVGDISGKGISAALLTLQR